MTAQCKLLNYSVFEDSPTSDLMKCSLCFIILLPILGLLRIRTNLPTGLNFKKPNQTKKLKPQKTTKKTFKRSLQLDQMSFSAIRLQIFCRLFLLGLLKGRNVSLSHSSGLWGEQRRARREPTSPQLLFMNPSKEAGFFLP